MLGLAVAAGITAPGLGLAAPDAQHPRLHGTQWCGTQAPPCVVSATRNGVAITPSDPDWDVSATGYTSPKAEHLVLWSVGSTHTTGSYQSMGPSEAGVPWTVTVNAGTHSVRAFDEFGDDIAVTTTANGDGTSNVTIAGVPVTTPVNDECHPVTPVSCPFRSGQDVTILQGEIGDFQQWSDASQWNDFTGLNLWTNVEETNIPPTISGTPLTITEDPTNSHELSDGTVFQGFWHAVLPNAFLVDMGIDDPSTLDPTGVATSIGSGTVHVTPGPASTRIDITGITFSNRTLKVKRGTITPTTPTVVHTRRAAAHRAAVGFTKSKRRGSKIAYYQARCVAPGQVTRTGTAKAAPVAVGQLVTGVAYTCSVRAKAKAGYSAWSKGKRVLV